MAAQSKRIDAAGVLRERILTFEQGCELRQVDAAREMRSVREYHGAPKVWIRFVLAVSARQVVEHRRIERIALRYAIQTDQEHMAEAFDSDVGHSQKSQSTT